MRPRLTFANVISVIALFVALGGGAYAAVKLKTNQVKSKHIAPDAATGADVNEASLGTVPRATEATNATNAGNAASVDGFTADDFQFGDGFDQAAADFIANGDTGGIATFEGAVGIECDASPSLAYVDLGPDAADTDIWVDSDHAVVVDEASTTFPLAPERTAQVHIWGGAGTVGHVVASVAWDGVDACAVAFTSQENIGVATLESADARALRNGGSRGELPDGWVELDGQR